MPRSKALLTQTASAVTLVREGEPTSVIVTGNQPTVVQQVAAAQLQYHLKRMTGALVPIVAEQELETTEAVRIYVGQSERLNGLGIDTTSLPPETLIVRTIDGALVLAGDDTGSREHDSFYKTEADPDIPYDDAEEGAIQLSNQVLCTGTLYAVYDFLQDELGCRWIWPGRTGEVIPRRKTVEIGELDVQETPKLFMRHYRAGYHGWPRDRMNRHVPRYMRIKGDRYFHDLQLQEQHWLTRVKMGQSDQPEYGHAFTGWYDKYHDTNPELFAMQPDGTRGLPRASYPRSFVKMCVANDQLVDMLIERFKARREANPNHRWLNACENDGGHGYCVCEDCRALDVELNEEVRAELKARGWDEALIERQYKPDSNGLPNALTNRYFHFYNKLARRLAEVAPDAYVVAYAYAKYQYAPIDLKVEPNILVGLIGFNNYPMTEQQHVREVSNVEAWKQAGVTRMFFRPNSLIFSPAWSIPWDESLAMGRDLKMLIDAGMVATDFDRSTGHWATAGPMYYVMARMQWDHEATAEALRKEFMAAFGPAAEPIEQYFDHWHEVFNTAYLRPDIEEIARQADPLGGRLGRRKAVPIFLTDEDFEQGRALLADARSRAAEAADEDLLQRLYVLELGLRHGELMVEGARYTIARQYDQPCRYDAFWPTVKEIHAVREELAALGVQNIFFILGWELQIHDPYETRVYYDFVGRPYKPIVTPTRRDWKFVPDPKDVGEVEGWCRKAFDPSLVLEAREHPAYQHLFYAAWDHYPPVAGWKVETGEDAVINGWYQIEFAIAEQDLQPEHVLYFPYIKGSAKIWINDQLVRELSAHEGAGDEAIVLRPAEWGIEANKPFRLTIKVHSPDASGGLIGPVYVAAPTSE